MLRSWALTMSSKPTSATSLPISMFNSWSVSITQIVEELLAVNTASGRLRDPNSSDRADFTEEGLDTRNSFGHGSFARRIDSLYPAMRSLMVRRWEFAAIQVIFL